ncbi:cyclin-dependent kinase 4 inhibitor B [Brachyistius frenatus]|uniref:cyclin-dependent kinase 4 inhibitor B n=1 Tax=Brachyistius frenatus TaxID=100188 RepID=UPI0037E7A477
MTMTLEDDLSAAAAKGTTADVRGLLAAGAQVNGVNSFGRTALQVMMMGSSPVAQLLLQRGADPNVTDSSTGTTPLHDAARTGFLDTVRLLVQFQADPQARDNANCLPIDLARHKGHAEVVAFLQAL